MQFFIFVRKFFKLDTYMCWFSCEISHETDDGHMRVKLMWRL